MTIAYDKRRAERYTARYKEETGFMEQNHRNPSCRHIEDYDMLNWLKATRKRIKAGEKKGERMDMFEKLFELI